MKIFYADSAEGMKTRGYTGFLALSFLLLLAAWIGGCSTSANQLRRGQDLVVEQRYVEAAFNFVRALEGGLQEDNTAVAKSSLLSIAPFLIEETNNVVSSAFRNGSWQRVRVAVEALVVLDRRARRVGVRLLDENEDQFAELCSQASMATIREAESLESDGQWGEAIALYNTARSQFSPDSTISRQLAFNQGRALVRYGEELLIEGDYAGALRAAMGALNRDAGPALMDQAARLRSEAEAVRLAQEVFIPTYYFAALPFSDTSGSAVPDEIHRAVNDTLRYAFWSQRPQLWFEHDRPSSNLSGGAAVNVIGEDPPNVLRVVVDRGLSGGVLADAEARRIGQDLDVDISLWGMLSDYEIQEIPDESDGSSIRRVRMLVSYRLVDVYGTGIIASGEFETAASARYEPNTLDPDAAVEGMLLAQQLSRPQISDLNGMLVRHAIADLQRAVKVDMLRFVASLN